MRYRPLMGLTIVVGLLGELDEEEKEDTREDLFRDIEALLQAEGLPAHREPEDTLEGIEYEMYGYSGLHYCRRAAAHIWKFDRVDQPGDETRRTIPFSRSTVDRSKWKTA